MHGDRMQYVAAAEGGTQKGVIANGTGARRRAVVEVVSVVGGGLVEEEHMGGLGKAGWAGLDGESRGVSQCPAIQFYYLRLSTTRTWVGYRARV